MDSAQINSLQQQFCPSISPHLGKEEEEVKGKVNKTNLLNTFWGSGKYTGPLWNPRTLYKKNQEDEVCWWASGSHVPLPLCRLSLWGWFLHHPHRSTVSQKDQFALLEDRTLVLNRETESHEGASRTAELCELVLIPKPRSLGLARGSLVPQSLHHVSLTLRAE